MDYVKRILGEAEEEEPKKKKKSEPEPEPAEKSEERPGETSDHASHEQEPDSEIKELANLWNTGNKDDLLRRFMEMDNETAVRVVFAIGREGALELARMADMEAASAGEEEPGGDTTEPVSVEPGQDFSIREITGAGNPEEEEQNLNQFRKDRSSSMAGDAVRQELGIK